MSDDNTPSPGQCLMAYLTDNKLTEYGQVILGSDVRAVLNITIPRLGTQKQFQNLALAELTAVDYCRNILLGKGKYLTQSGGDYRILLPSENARQVEVYVSQADRKLKRALKLSKSSQQLATNQQPDNTNVRIMMKREAIRNRVDFGDKAGKRLAEGGGHD
jgi:hypothetical protein